MLAPPRGAPGCPDLTRPSNHPPRPPQIHCLQKHQKTVVKEMPLENQLRYESSTPTYREPSSSIFPCLFVRLVILVVQPLGRLVNSLDRINGGLQLMGSRILWAPVRFGQGNPKCIVFATVSTQHGSSSGIY